MSFNRYNFSRNSVIYPIIFFVLLFILLIPATQAQDTPTMPETVVTAKKGGIFFNPQVSIGNITRCEDGDESDPNCGMVIGPDSIGKLIQNIYNYSIGIVGILSVAVMIFGGLLYITAAGNAGKMDNAKAWIGAAITGLVLALFSYTVMYTVNPNTLTFRSINLTEIGSAPACCDPQKGPVEPINEEKDGKITYSCESPAKPCGDNKKCFKIEKDNWKCIEKATAINCSQSEDPMVYCMNYCNNIGMRLSEGCIEGKCKCSN